MIYQVGLWKHMRLHIFWDFAYQCISQEWWLWNQTGGYTIGSIFIILFICCIHVWCLYVEGCKALDGSRQSWKLGVIVWHLMEWTRMEIVETCVYTTSIKSDKFDIVLKGKRAVWGIWFIGRCDVLSVIGSYWWSEIEARIGCIWSNLALLLLYLLWVSITCGVMVMEFFSFACEGCSRFISPMPIPYRIVLCYQV